MTYRFMSVMAGNYAGFEEASRALFANDHEGLQNQIADVPRDVRNYVIFLASGNATAASGVHAAHQ